MEGEGEGAIMGTDFGDRVGALLQGPSLLFDPPRIHKVGAAEGNRVGWSDDASDGAKEGSAVGDTVGESVGWNVGALDGDGVGLSVGDSVGSGEGCSDGWEVNCGLEG